MNEEGQSDPAGVGAQQAGLGRTRPWRSPASARRSAVTAAPLRMLGLLGVQFLLGMAVNLYVQLPSRGASMEGMIDGGLVVIHMILGLLLAAGVLLAVALALPYGRAAAGCAAAALVGILVAGLGGLLFLMDGRGNGASYLMAVGFLVAVVGYVTELVGRRSGKVTNVAPGKTRWRSAACRVNATGCVRARHLHISSRSCRRSEVGVEIEEGPR